MKLAGIAVNALPVLALAELLVHAGHGDTAALLLDAQAAGADRIGLSTRGRGAILAVLHKPPDDLRQLRGALVVDRRRSDRRRRLAEPTLLRGTFGSGRGSPSRGV